jgi:putative SOS response-associated peptidase YedK
VCGRYTLKTPAGEIAAEFSLKSLPELRPRYNVAPSQDVLIVREGDDAPCAELVRWGLVPFWARDPSIGNRMINARAETVREKPAFRAAFAKRRCLVIADGFYEWQRAPGGKRPYRIRRRDDGVFAFAGLWDEWGTGPDRLRSCTILTTAPNALVGRIHDRMPVILGGGALEEWLCAGTDPARCAALLVPCPEDELEAFEVSTLVNSPANDRPECLIAVPAEPAAPDLWTGT